MKNLFLPTLLTLGGVMVVSTCNANGYEPSFSCQSLGNTKPQITLTLYRQETSQDRTNNKAEFSINGQLQVIEGLTKGPNEEIPRDPDYYNVSWSAKSFLIKGYFPKYFPDLNFMAELNVDEKGFRLSCEIL